MNAFFVALFSLITRWDATARARYWDLAGALDQIELDFLDAIHGGMGGVEIVPTTLSDRRFHLNLIMRVRKADVQAQMADSAVRFALRNFPFDAVAEVLHSEWEELSCEEMTADPADVYLSRMLERGA